MLRIFATLAFFMMSASSYAEDALFPALPAANLVVTYIPEKFQTIELPAVDVENCDPSNREWIGVKCEAAPGSTLVLRNGAVITPVKISHVVYLQKGVAGSRRHEYHFIGSWSGVVRGIPVFTELELIVWYYPYDPKNLRGTIYFDHSVAQFPVYGVTVDEDETEEIKRG